MIDLELAYCPAADPDLDKRCNEEYTITKKTIYETKACLEALGHPCTMEEVKLMHKWMDIDPYETLNGQYGEYVNENLQKGGENIGIGLKCLRAYMKGIVRINTSDPLETEFSFDDNGSEYSFKMPTMLGKYFIKNKIQWG